MQNHILCFDSFPAWGGGQGKLSKRMQMLRAQGYRVTLVCPQESPFRTSMAPPDVQVIGLPMGRALTDWSSSPGLSDFLKDTSTLTYALLRIFREQKPKLVDALGSRSAKSVLPAAMLYRVPLAWSAGNLYRPDRFDKVLLHYSSAVVCVSNSIREQYLSVASDPSKLHVLYNSVDISQFHSVERTEFRNELGLCETDVLVGLIGRVSPQKGQVDFTQAILPLLEEFDNLHAVLVGAPHSQDQGYLDAIEALVAHSSVKQRFHLVGWRTDIPQITGALDVSILASYVEGLPHVVLEAMAAGTPVIATAIGSLPEVVLDGTTGILVTPGDKDALRLAIRRFLLHPEDRRRFGAAGYARALELFDDRTNLPRYAQIIDGALSSHGRQ